MAAMPLSAETGLPVTACFRSPVIDHWDLRSVGLGGRQVDRLGQASRYGRYVHRRGAVGAAVSLRSDRDVGQKPCKRLSVARRCNHILAFRPCRSRTEARTSGPTVDGIIKARAPHRRRVEFAP